VVQFDTILLSIPLGVCVANSIPRPYLRAYDHVPSEHGGGSGVTGVFRFAEIQVENFRRLPVTISSFPGTQFDVLIGRDILQHCRLMMDQGSRIYTLDMP